MLNILKCFVNISLQNVINVYNDRITHFNVCIQVKSLITFLLIPEYVFHGLTYLPQIVYKELSNSKADQWGDGEITAGKYYAYKSSVNSGLYL